MIDYIAAFFVALTGLLLLTTKVDYGELPRAVRVIAQVLMFGQTGSCLYAGWRLAFG